MKEFFVWIAIIFSVGAIASCADNASGPSVKPHRRRFLVQPLAGSGAYAFCNSVNWSQEATFTDCEDGYSYINPQKYKVMEE